MSPTNNTNENSRSIKIIAFIISLVSLILITIYLTKIWKESRISQKSNEFPVSNTNEPVPQENRQSINQSFQYEDDVFSEQQNSHSPETSELQISTFGNSVTNILEPTILDFNNSSELNESQNSDYSIQSPINQNNLLFLELPVECFTNNRRQSHELLQNYAQSNEVDTSQIGNMIDDIDLSVIDDDNFISFEDFIEKCKRKDEDLQSYLNVLNIAKECSENRKTKTLNIMSEFVVNLCSESTSINGLFYHDDLVYSFKEYILKRRYCVKILAYRNNLGEFFRKIFQYLRTKCRRESPHKAFDSFSLYLIDLLMNMDKLDLNKEMEYKRNLVQEFKDVGSIEYDWQKKLVLYFLDKVFGNFVKTLNEEIGSYSQDNDVRRKEFLSEVINNKLNSLKSDLIEESVEFIKLVGRKQQEFLPKIWDRDLGEIKLYYLKYFFENEGLIKSIVANNDRSSHKIDDLENRFYELLKTKYMNHEFILIDFKEYLNENFDSFIKLLKVPITDRY